MPIRKNASTVILSILLAILSLAAAACNGQNDQAASDLLSAFQTGCSLDGNYLQQALNQTQNFALTIQDLQKNNSCSGVSGALSAIQNLQSQISMVSNDPYSSQISNLSAQQKILMLQINQTTDPATLANLSVSYSTNLLDMTEAQAALVTATGGLSKTPLENGSSQLEGYVSQLLSDQTNILQCSQDNPALAAQLGAGMIAVAGSFTPSVAGIALSLAGNTLSSALSFVHDSSYASELNNLNQVAMTTALPCGLEQMADVYCQAQDIMDISHLEECSYNPQATGCAPITAKSTVSTTQFWQGLDVLVRELPALQIWLNQVVTGITPSNPYAAQQMNDAATAVSTMDNVSRLAQGVMKDEEVKIATLTTVADQDKELRNGLAILQSVLSFASTSTGCISNLGFSNCTNTPLLVAEGSAIQVLYDLVGRDPSLDSCNPSSQFSQSCQNANAISLEGVQGASELLTWEKIETNAGGLPNATGTGKNLIGATLSRELSLEHQQLNTDPSDLLEKVDAPSGEGLPSPVKSLTEIDAFLKASYAFFSDKSQSPDSLLDGGAAMRPGILGLLAESDEMIIDVITALGTMNGTSDLNALTTVYNTLQLAKDRNFIFNRLTDQIKLDVHTRIMAGQVPSNIYDILAQTNVDPTIGLTQIPPDQLETTLASLGQAQVTAQLNLQDFASFFSKSFNSILTLLKSQADANGEPLAANPRTAPNRAAQARVCLLLVSSQNKWPDGVDTSLCRGLSYQSELTGEALSFNAFYTQMQKGTTLAPQRMCTFYHFYRTSENYVQEKQGH
jgi:hypothetical protein